MGTMRSPNFPAIALQQAIDLVEKVFREDRTNAIEKEDAAKHMGYTSLNGRTLKLLGALSQFGLVEKVSKGQIRVSRTAVSILHPGDDAERLDALLRAGRSPGLFKRIRDAYPDDPSDRTITSYLMREGFTDSAVPSVLKSYRDTSRFLAESGVSESHGQADDNEAESLANDDEEDTPVIETPARDFHKPPPAIQRPESEQHELRVNFDMRSVSLSGRTTSPMELSEFIDALTSLNDLFKKLAPDVAD